MLRADVRTAGMPGRADPCIDLPRLLLAASATLIVPSHGIRPAAGHVPVSSLASLWVGWGRAQAGLRVACLQVLKGQGLGRALPRPGAARRAARRARCR